MTPKGPKDRVTMRTSRSSSSSSDSSSSDSMEDLWFEYGKPEDDPC